MITQTTSTPSPSLPSQTRAKWESEINRPGLSIVRVFSLITVGLVMFVLGAAGMWAINRSASTIELISPLVGKGTETPPPNPYPKYSFSQLEQRQFTPGAIRIESLIDSQPTYASFLVSWDVPDLETGTRSKVTGQLNIPQGNGPFPVIVMLRGYAEKEIYSTGLGTRNAAAVLARSGYITIAPDFMGYGGSDPESNDILLARFSRPLTVLQLLRNLDTLSLERPSDPGSSTLTSSSSAIRYAPDFTTARLFDTQHIGMWGHSNGGQIALSVLEISNRAIPTTLWAPVSMPFPFSVLYYTDESPDGGKYLRKQLAHFEFTLGNDPDEFSVLHQPERILGPIQIHQGGTDDAVPMEWSQHLLDTLDEATVEATLFKYPAADHNLQPNWDEVVQRDLVFFEKSLR